MQLNKNWKKCCALGVISIITLGLTGCAGINNTVNDMSNHNKSYTAPAKQTLHNQTVVQPITVDYYDAHNTSQADAMMKQRINNYLDSINNLSEYQKPQFKLTNVSLDGNHNGNQAETVEVILYRK